MKITNKENLSSLQYANIILFLTIISGACGLAYEIIYIRLFSNYFGNSFLMSGLIVSAVFFGIAYGAWQNERFLKKLALIEITIGIYAFVVITIFSYWGFEIVSIGSYTALNALKLIFFLGVPAFLIGTCIPLFTAYAQTEKQTSNTFSKIYGLYNIGAFLSILAIEFLLIRIVGLQVTGYLIGFLNLLIGFVLLKTKASEKIYTERVSKVSLNRSIVVALFFASFASGVFQLFVLRISFSIFGPLNENFAIILAAAILGVSIGTWVTSRNVLSLKTSFLWLVVFGFVFMIFSPILVDAWVSMSAWEIGDFEELLAKIFLLSGYSLPIFILLGTLVPLSLREHGRTEYALSGRLLAFSALGNGGGSLAMFWFFHKYFSAPVIGMIIISLFALSYLVLTYKKVEFQKAAGGVLVSICLLFSVFQVWPTVDLLLGYRVITSPTRLAHSRSYYEDEVTYKAFDQSASLISFKDKTQSLVFNGYQSLTFGPDSKAVLHEVIVGASPGLFSEKTDKALVFGLGTGITAGSTARLYTEAKVVEINPAIFNIPKHFEAENYNVVSRRNVNVVLEDGISTLLNDETTYDAIVNTVTSPQYYAASKLYTSEFYDIVKSRLSRGGVYSSWFDLNIDQIGVSVMLNTLEDSFKNCRYFVLSGAYFNALCSDDPLIYKSTKRIKDRVNGLGFDELFQQHRFERGFVETLSALEVSFDNAFFNRLSSAINTLDKPLLEFIVARQSDKDVTAKILNKTILKNIEHLANTSFGGTDWVLDCRVLGQMSAIKFKGC